MRRATLTTLVAALSACAGFGAKGEEPDPAFDARVARPAYTDTHPAVLFDCAHHNYYSVAGTYKLFKPFGDLLAADGYRVVPGRQKFTKAALAPYKLLVIAGVMGGPWRNKPEASQSAFTPEECDAVRDWVEAGGALLFVTDVHPLGASARELAKRFGVEMSDGRVADPLNGDVGGRTHLVFSRENGLLGDHPLTRGRDASERLGHVVAFNGQSLKGPAGAVPFLKLSDTAADQEVEGVKGKEAPARGRAMGLAMTPGKGRLVVVGDATMLTAIVNGADHKPIGMNVPGNDDRQLTLNVMHWLSGLDAADPAPAAVAAVVRPSLSPSPSPPAAEPKPGRALSAADIAEESEPSIALVKGKGATGTGFLVRPNVLVTNAHVISDEFLGDLEVAFPSAEGAKKGPFPAELLYEDPRRDLAFLSVKVDLPPVRVAASYSFRKGEDVTVIGNPGLGGELILENAISRGVMSTKTALNGQNFYQLGVAINPGNSGGPVFDSAGQVIGVATLKSTRQEALAFCIPVEDVRKAMEAQAGLATAGVNKVRSDHRAAVAAQDLGTGGAFYCFGIDLRRASASPALKANPEIRAASQKVDEVIVALNKEALPTVVAQVASARKDALLAPAVRDKLGRLADNLDKLKAAYGDKPLALKKEALLALKSAHRQLMTDLYAAFQLELPAKLMPAFDDHPLPQTAVLTNAVPAAPGSARQRIQDRRDLGSRAGSRAGSNGPRDRPGSKASRRGR